jgi:IS30 family transposase
MGRVIAEHKIEQIKKARAEDKDALGPLLGEFVIEGNVPVEAVAELVKVSGTTVYRWMYGESHPGKVYEPYIKKLLTILRKAKRAKQLPLEGSTKARIKQTGQLVIEHRPPISR